MALKFGFSQINNPAPLLYRRFLSVLIIFIIPSTATFIIGLPLKAMTDETKIIIGLFATYVLALLRGLEYLLGNNKNNEEPATLDSGS